MKATKLFIKGIIISVAATVVIASLNYLTRRLLALNLSQEEYGFFYSLFSLTSFCMIFFNFGFTQTAVIQISKSLSSNNRHKAAVIYSALITVNVLAGILMALIMLLLSDWLINVYFKYPPGYSILFIMLIFVPFQALYRGVFATIEGTKDFRTRNILWCLFFIIIFASVVLGIKKYGLWVPTIAYICSAAIVASIGITVLSRSHKIKLRVSNHFYPVLHEMWQLARWVAVSIFILNAMTCLDTMMLTYFIGLKAVALYNVALPIMQIMLIMAIIPTIFIPIAAELWHEQKITELKNILNGVTAVFVLLSWPALCFFTLFASDLISILFKPEYIPAASATALLCFGAFFAVLLRFYLNTLNAIEESRKACITIICGGIFNVIANIVLIKTMGLNGAALATSLSYILTFLTMFFLINRKLKLGFPVIKIIVLSTVGMVSVALLTLYDIHHETLIIKIMTLSIIVVIYLLCIIVILRKFSMQLLKMITYQLKKRVHQVKD